MGWCLSPAQAQQQRPSSSSNKKVHLFNTSYNNVWNAIQLAMGSYPLDVNDIKTGVIKTQKLTYKETWTAPFESPLPSNYQQVLHVTVFKVSPRITQVTIEKQASAQVDFVGTTKSLDTSGWEELRLFYKIRRHIDLERVLKRIKVN